MKILIFCLLISLNLSAYKIKYSYKTQVELTKRYKNEITHLSLNQYKVLLKTYAKAKPFDKSLTMCAIAWEESQFGKFPVNLSDPSFGVFHNNLNSVMRRHHYKNTKWKRSRVAEALLLDYDFAFSESLSELELWQSYWKRRNVHDKWINMVRSYNTGSSWTSKERYIDRIILRVRVLKRYIKIHKFIFQTLNYKCLN